jgi:hypothetical protein
MKSLVLNAVGRGFELDDVDIAAPVGGAAVLGHEVDGSLNRVVVTSF